MKVCDAIQRVRELKPNQYDDETLVRWLSDLDGQIWQDALCNYQDAPPAPEPYTTNSMDQQLLADHPHEEMYITYLSARIDLQNGEYERYNNTMMMYNMQLQNFYNAFNRKHRPKADVFIGF